jgi:hypothetical protein
MMFVTSIIDDPNPRGAVPHSRPGALMMETPGMRVLAVRELDPKSGSPGGSGGRRLDRLRTVAADLEKINMMTDDQMEQLQPTSDFDIAKISARCRKHGYTCHVSLRAELKLRKKQFVRPGSRSFVL